METAGPSNAHEAGQGGGIPPGFTPIELPPEPEGAGNGKGRARGGPGASDATRLVELALDRFRLVRSPAGDPFAVPKAGAHLARPIRPKYGSLREELAATYYLKHGYTAGGTALVDALTTLTGMARDLEEIHLRVAAHEGRIIIDLGDDTGQCVSVGAEGWQLLNRSPVAFRRTQQSAPLPVPERGGELREIRELLNVSDDLWPLLLGWMIAAWFPSIPRPILVLTGLHGTGKSMATKFIQALIDPCNGGALTPPQNLDNWAVSAAASWVVTVDNVSQIPDWWSDALCRAVTGGAMVKRELYSDDGLVILAFRRAIILNGIDLSTIRGDLADRLMLIDLERIEARLEETPMHRRFAERRPAMLGALLDLLASVLRELPNVTVPAPPRLADAARVFAAMDQVLGTKATAVFTGQSARVAEDVIESEPAAAAVRAFALQRAPWSGQAKDLLDLITPQPAPKHWPGTPRKLSGILRRAIPHLRDVGVSVTAPSKNPSRDSSQPEAKKARLWHIALANPSDAAAPTLPVQTSAPTAENPDAEPDPFGEALDGGEV